MSPDVMVEGDFSSAFPFLTHPLANSNFQNIVSVAGIARDGGLEFKCWYYTGCVLQHTQSESGVDRVACLDERMIYRSEDKLDKLKSV